MRPVGFSTGALAYGDFRAALRMLDQKNVQALELSALRQNELVPLLQALPSLDLSGFRYVSIHAPSQFDANWEAVLCERISGTWISESRSGAAPGNWIKISSRVELPIP